MYLQLFENYLMSHSWDENQETFTLPLVIIEGHTGSLIYGKVYINPQVGYIVQR